MSPCLPRQLPRRSFAFHRIGSRHLPFVLCHYIRPQSISPTAVVQTAPQAANVLLCQAPILVQLFERTASSSQPTSSDFNVARRFWGHDTRRPHFVDVHRDVLQRRVTNGLQKLLRFKTDDDGLLRCHRRLVHANLPLVAKHPILLPRTSHFTRLVIHDTHDKVFHGGVSHTLANVRLRYWIPLARAVPGVTKLHSLQAVRWPGLLTSSNAASATSTHSAVGSFSVRRH